jgi:hypothetical protein
MSGEDRRRALRRVACFPGLIKHGEQQVTAMIADLAEGGALLLLRNPDWSAGDEVRLELHVALDDGPPRIATGHVVRVEPLPDQRASLWTHQCGVEFTEPITLSTAEIDSLEKRQEPYGKRRST